MEDLSKRTLRDLVTLARERLGTAASALKTRDELLSALGAGVGQEEASTPPGLATVNSPDRAVRVETPQAPPEPILTRDFFRRRG